MEYTNFIKKSLEEASVIARENFGKVSSTVKMNDNNQVLTKADLEIGKSLIAKIKEYFPDYNIIDEEVGIINNGSEYTWVIDPIDGTSNFANGIPLYGIMLGLLKNDLPIAGGLALPSFSEIYIAEKGTGTFCNGEKINVSSENDLKNSLVAYGIDGHQESPELTRTECLLLTDIVLSIRNLRSSNSVFDIAMVARGKYGAFLNRTSKIWDNVAQQIIIEEAGGIYTDFFGKKINYSDIFNDPQRNFTFCAAPPELHKQLILIILNK
ncbi:MAG: inositol monophosphatase [Parcubacteria group bacterium]